MRKQAHLQFKTSWLFYLFCNFSVTFLQFNTRSYQPAKNSNQRKTKTRKGRYRDHSVKSIFLSCNHHHIVTRRRPVLLKIHSCITSFSECSRENIHLTVSKPKINENRKYYHTALYSKVTPGNTTDLWWLFPLTTVIYISFPRISSWLHENSDTEKQLRKRTVFYFARKDYHAQEMHSMVSNKGISLQLQWRF